jgi:hypothetical protein
MNVEMPSGAYRAAIEDLLTLEGLSPDTVAAICEPQVLFLTEEYRNAPVRVMVVGQETGDAEKWLKEAVSEGAEAMIARQRRSFEDFDFAIGTPHDRSPFWRGYDEVCTAFGLSSRRATAWTNISKVQLGEAVGSSVSIESLSAEARMEIVRWQQAMARAEIEYAKPDVIVHVTGGMRWLAGHLYKSDPLADRSDVLFNPIDGAGNTTGSITAPFLGDAVSVYTYHPNGGRTSEAKARTASERKLALDWAARRWAERGL